MEDLISQFIQLQDKFRIKADRYEDEKLAKANKKSKKENKALQGNINISKDLDAASENSSIVPAKMKQSVEPLASPKLGGERSASPNNYMKRPDSQYWIPVGSMIQEDNVYPNSILSNQTRF